MPENFDLSEIAKDPENYQKLLDRVLLGRSGISATQIVLDAVQTIRFGVKIAEVERWLFLDVLVQAFTELKDIGKVVSTTPGRPAGNGTGDVDLILWGRGSPNEQARSRIEALGQYAQKIHQSLLSLAVLDDADTVITTALATYEKKWSDDYGKMLSARNNLEIWMRHAPEWFTLDIYFKIYEAAITMKMLNKWYKLYRVVTSFDLAGAITTTSIQLKGADLRRKLRMDELTKLDSPEFDGNAVSSYYQGVLARM